ncbi:DUF4397 domain-containing protein [Anaerolentibacter hominis]|uniref:DUF4397 domain-containing protein n=1 Tax=Anaerolentibacter hominis TaxID=3079009 RepID=UPI0031B881E2
MADYNQPAVPGFGPSGSVTPELPDDNTPAAPGFGPVGPVTPELPNDNQPAAPGFGPVGPVTPTLPDMNQPAAPGFGPVGPVMPELPDMNQPATPGFGPVGPVTPTLPGNNGTGNLWSWGVVAPIFSNGAAIAHVRFYNAAAIREPLDVYLNNQPVIYDLDYTEYTDYLHIIPGFYRVTVYRRTNPGEAIIDVRAQFKRNTTYTAAILGDASDYFLQLLTC